MIDRDATCPITGTRIPMDPLRYVPHADPTRDAVRRWQRYAEAVVGLRAARDLRRRGLVVVPPDMLMPEVRMALSAEASDQRGDHSDRSVGSSPSNTSEESQGS